MTSAGTDQQGAMCYYRRICDALDLLRYPRGQNADIPPLWSRASIRQNPICDIDRQWFDFSTGVPGVFNPPKGVGFGGAATSSCGCASVAGCLPMRGENSKQNCYKDQGRNVPIQVAMLGRHFHRLKCHNSGMDKARPDGKPSQAEIVQRASGSEKKKHIECCVVRPRIDTTRA